MFLFTAALLWLGVGSLIAVLSSIKMHAPGMLAGQDWLTYGRIRPVAVDIFLYGFLSQAGIHAGNRAPTGIPLQPARITHNQKLMAAR